jgi:hypothetical protein
MCPACRLVLLACVAALVGGTAMYYYRRGGPGSAPGSGKLVQLGSMLPGSGSGTAKYVPLVQEQGQGSVSSSSGGVPRPPERSSSGGSMKLGAQKLTSGKRSDSWNNNW